MSGLSDFGHSGDDPGLPGHLLWNCSAEFGAISFTGDSESGAEGSLSAASSGVDDCFITSGSTAWHPGAAVPAARVSPIPEQRPSPVPTAPGIRVLCVSERECPGSSALDTIRLNQTANFSFTDIGSADTIVIKLDSNMTSAFDFGSLSHVTKLVFRSCSGAPKSALLSLDSFSPVTVSDITFTDVYVRLSGDDTSRRVFNCPSLTFNGTTDLDRSAFELVDFTQVSSLKFSSPEVTLWVVNGRHRIGASRFVELSHIDMFDFRECQVRFNASTSHDSHPVDLTGIVPRLLLHSAVTVAVSGGTRARGIAFMFGGFGASLTVEGEGPPGFLIGLTVSEAAKGRLFVNSVNVPVTVDGSGLLHVGSPEERISLRGVSARDGGLTLSVPVSLNGVAADALVFGGSSSLEVRRRSFEKVLGDLVELTTGNLTVEANANALVLGVVLTGKVEIGPGGKIAFGECLSVRNTAEFVVRYAKGQARPTAIELAATAVGAGPPAAVMLIADDGDGHPMPFNVACGIGFNCESWRNVTVDPSGDYRLSCAELGAETCLVAMTAAEEEEEEAHGASSDCSVLVMVVAEAISILVVVILLRLGFVLLSVQLRQMLSMKRAG
jgi:hypothetical protein